MTQKTARVSDDGLYRYGLTRRWSEGLLLTFIMLNPSTADAFTDDPTIRRCMGFARGWGYAGIEVLNLYAYRSTSPKGLWLPGVEPVGPVNNELLTLALARCAAAAQPVVAAWGANARDDRVRWLLAQDGASALHCLGTTKAGAPRHPLYVKGDTALVPWTP